ncbi:RNase III inhibitor [Aquisphaera giovannonii]|uniref:RNase III inhibitor n=1 Tax=Aquisphaera giovannonii TaxID=406548 RepID=A0A5B9VV68_9BACT|nr:macro domain-containing protein [Aquisphaera giovannonii]QEH31711.1 RNase III inhibitor [Aquisphaera giovannonii]
MWKRTEGNILEADVQALVNTVNTVGVMGKGIALQFKKAFPEMFEAYEAVCKAKTLRPGLMHVYDRGQMFNPRYIINFPTKRHWKGKSRIADIEAGLDALVEELTARDIKSVAIPPLGCGHGGLDWDEVRPLIEQAMDRVPEVEALIYAPKGAPEPAAIVNRTERPEMTPSRANMLRLLSEYCVLGYDLTLLEIQKILYFLQVAGEPLKLRFAKDRYGPYADNLRHVLHRFEGHFLVGFGDGRNSPRTPIRLFEEAVSEAVQVSERSSTPEQKDRVRRVFDLIEGFESPYGMELLASVHWVAAQEGVPSEPAAVVQAVHAWNDHKRKTMKPEHIHVAWNRLQDLGWLGRDTTSHDDRE